MTRPANLPHRLDRTLLIRARRETVFRFFTDPVRWASWWGPGSTIDPKTGGRVLIKAPGAVEAIGEVVEIVAPERLTFTYGYTGGKPIAPGASLVTIRLEAVGANTRVDLTHEFAVSDAAVRDEHVQGWRYQLSLFANAVTNDLHAGAEPLVDSWMAAWSNADGTARRTALSGIVAPDVQFMDRFSTVAGLDELQTHLDATHHFMPGLRLERDGAVRQCQGVALADWIARSTDGEERARGTNVFVLNSDGRIESVTGLWSRHPRQ